MAKITTEQLKLACEDGSLSHDMALNIASERDSLHRALETVIQAQGEQFKLREDAVHELNEWKERYAHLRNHSVMTDEHESLRDELGKATAEYYLGVQAYGVRIAELEEELRYAMSTTMIQNLNHRIEYLCSLLQRSLQLPRPWMDGGITWKKWDELFSDIQRAIDEKSSFSARPRL